MSNLQERIEEIREAASAKIFKLLRSEQPKEIPVEVTASGIAVRNLINVSSIDYLLKILNKISLPQKINLQLENDFSESFGRYYIVLKQDDNIRYSEYFNYIKIENSCLGAWQAYLLWSLWHQLPLYEHSNYYQRFPIYSANDFDSLNVDDKDIKQQLNNANISLCVNGIKGLYFISCCYWCHFSGLNRIFCEIHIENDKVTYIKEFKIQNIVSYGSDLRI